MSDGLSKPTLRAVALIVAAVFLLVACEPFTVRIKGGSESKPSGEIGVKF